MFSDSGVRVEDSSVEPLTLSALAEKLASIAGSSIQVSDFVDGKAFVYVRVAQPSLSVPAGAFKSVIIQPFEHGSEEDLVEIAKHISGDAELWITGNDDAAGIAALGAASCIVAESPEYKVFSLLFEDHSLDEAAREKAVHDLRRNSLLLEQHMKISKNGEVFVRRLVHGSAEVNEIAIPAAGPPGASGALAAHFPPTLRDTDVEIHVKALGVESPASSKSALTFVGHVKSRGNSVARVELETLVCFP
jgi:hypothetical protein